MKNYLLIANDEHSHESTELGIIKAYSLKHAALFLAYHFPNQYYSANIVELDYSGNHVACLSIPCKEEEGFYAHRAGQDIVSPVDSAVRGLMLDMAFDNCFCDTREDYQGRVCISWRHIKSVGGRIVKDNREEA